jgi:hypothetical protein
MVLTQGWVNAISIVIVTVALVRLWYGVRAGHAQLVGEGVTGTKEPVSSVDAYLLLECTRGNRAEGLAACLPKDQAKALTRGGEAQPMAARAEDAGLFVDGYLLLEHTRENRAELGRSEMCGCLYCEQLYRPGEIAGWVGDTAVCPRCRRKAVVGSGAGIVLTRELLRRSHAVGD